MPFLTTTLPKSLVAAKTEGLTHANNRSQMYGFLVSHRFSDSRPVLLLLTICFFAGLAKVRHLDIRRAGNPSRIR
jgi:hypothetical protein